ncbi:hypothetical protein GCM10009821_17670 [Aeromicrobium halocynthiae]|uniref:Polyketide cyclase n=1 Tax=Aeromicrobium halocynthiae TaxID=560557 RepID=A0ABN2VZ48_9ACTN
MLADRWGVDERDIRRRYGCDELLPDAPMRVLRGVDVDAPVDVLWRWVRQLRLAPYSYDWIDNGGRRSPRTLRDLPEPDVGDPYTAFRGRPIGRVEAVDPPRELTVSLIGAVMTYPLTERPRGGSRLVFVMLARGRRPLLDLLSAGDLVMARRQLLTLKELAEETI